VGSCDKTISQNKIDKKIMGMDFTLSPELFKHMNDRAEYKTLKGAFIS
jgi:hypothetical protein